MRANPLVSIIMPVYNVEQYIQESVRSVIRQTYMNIELILVDDASPDASIEKAQEVLATSEIQYRIIRQENAGQGASRNAGLAAAKGDWICFLDSDDLISDNAIEHMIAATKARDVDLVFSRFNGIKDAKDAIKLCKAEQVVYMDATTIQLAFLKRTLPILAPGSLYRKDFLIKNSLAFVHIPWSEDQHFLWRVLYHLSTAAFVNEPLYQYLKHPGSIMTASKAQAMANSYHSILELDAYYAGKEAIARFIVPRWVMGTMNAASALETRKNWKKLWLELNGRKNFKRLLRFPDAKTRILAFVGYACPFLYYHVLRSKRGK